MRYLSQAINAGFILNASVSKNRHSTLNMGSGIIPSEQKDNVILDGVGLATTSGIDEYNSKTFKELNQNGMGLDITSYQNGEKTDYNVKTPNNNYKLSTIAQVDNIGFHAKSYLVHQKPINPIDRKGIDSLRIAFGGTRGQDWSRTFAMHVTKLPLHNEKKLREFIDLTLETYKKNNPNIDLPDNIVLSGHSAGATHANKAYEILKEKGVKSDLHLHLYEPFGAKFSKMKPEDEKKAISYTSHNTFLKCFIYDGNTIGKVKELPESSSQKKVAAGKAVGMVQWGILGNAIAASVKGHMIDSIIESALQNEDKKEPEVQALRKSQSMDGLTRFVPQVLNSRLSKNYSTGVLRT